MDYPEPFQIFVHELSKFPGIGKKNAEKLAFYIFLKADRTSTQNLSESILKIKDQIKFCQQCFFLTEEPFCNLCKDHTREKHILCVVENFKTLINIERTKEYKGLYHILMGRISPIEKIKPSDIKIKELINRLDKSFTNDEQEPIKELLLACSPNLEGNMTELYIAEQIKKYQRPIKITSLAKGIPMGTSVEFADLMSLGNSILKRELFEL